MKKLPSKNIQVLAFYGLTAASLFPSDSLLFSKVGNPLLEEYTVHTWALVKLVSVLVEKKIQPINIFIFSALGERGPFKWFSAGKRHNEIWILERSFQRRYGEGRSLARYILLFWRFTLSKSFLSILRPDRMKEKENKFSLCWWECYMNKIVWFLSCSFSLKHRSKERKDKENHKEPFHIIA